MKIIHVLGDSSYGGAAKSILRLAKLWGTAGWEVSILTSDPQFQQAAKDEGLSFAGVDCIWREIRPWKDLIGLVRLWRFLRKEQVTIVHTHTTKAGFVGRIAARLAGVPIVIHTVHGFAFHEGSSRAKIGFYAFLEKIAGYCCDRIITVSHFHKQWALDLQIAPDAKLKAIPNGIPDIQEAAGASRKEVRASLGIPDGEVMLFTPGRLALEKGLEDLLAAVANTQGRLQHTLHLVLAGDGPLRSVLEQNAQTLGLFGQVRFLGFRTDIGDLLKASDIVALPSLREGLSISLLESMSAGRAIIATTIGSNLEAVGGSENLDQAALMIEPGNRHALTEAIIHLTEDSALRDVLGKQARCRWEQNYTLEQAQDKYIKTYQQLLASRFKSSADPLQTPSTTRKGPGG